MSALAALGELEELDRFLTASAARAQFGDHVCMAAQPDTVNGSPEVLVDDGVSDGARIAGGWAAQIVDALDGKGSEFEIRAALQNVAKHLDPSEFATHAEQIIMRGLMLGALDSVWEREHDQDVAPATFAAAPPPGRQFVYQPFTSAVAAFEQRQVLPPAAFNALADGAKRRAFTVAGLAKQELLDATHAELLRQLRESVHQDDRGANLRDFKKFAKERLEKAGWTPANPSHVETIFRTNAVSAYSGGRVVEMTQPKVLALLPYWQIRTVKDARQRPTHRAADGIVLPANHPFWLHAYPPFGFSCRCRVNARTRAWVERSGVSTVSVPVGLPDPGFESGTRALISVPPQALQPVAKVTEQVAPAPAWHDHETLDRLSAATEKVDGPTLRRGLRDAIQQVMPGVMPRRARVPMQIADEALDRANADGGYTASGEVLITSGVRDAAASFFARAKLSAPQTFARHEVNAARVLLHEELHSHSRVSPGIYQHAAVQTLEEVGTELNARHVLRQLRPDAFSGANATGSYEEWISGLTNVVAQATGRANNEARELLRAAHEKSMLRSGETITEPAQYVAEWLGALDVTDSQRSFIARHLAF